MNGEKRMRASVFLLLFGAVVDPRGVVVDRPIIKSSSIFAELGKVFVLSCISNDSVSLKWHISDKCSNHLYFDYVSRSDQITTTNTLVILPVKNDLSLRCSSRSKTWAKSLQIVNYSLEVRYKPFLLGSNYSWHSGVGGEARLYCRFDGKPTGTVTWYLNGKRIRENRVTLVDRYRCESFANTVTSVLEVNSITYADYGSYKCIAENELGKAEGTIKIRRNYGRIGDMCLDDYDCFEPNSFCNAYSESCECRSGYYYYETATRPSCQKASKITEACEFDGECVDQFSECDRETKGCKCSSNFVAVWTIEWNFPKCFPIRPTLFSYCSYDEQCRVRGSRCVDSLCLCDDRHKHHWNQTARRDSCVEKTFLFTGCASARNLCELGGFAHSTCVSNACVCADGFRYNKETHRCEGFDVSLIVIITVILTLNSYLFKYVHA